MHDDAHKYAGIVLCIDSDERNLQVMERNLGHMGYIVHTETSARRGIQVARQVQPDVILVDPTLSDLSGPDIVAGLRGLPALSQTPLILLTEAGDENVLQRCAQIGFDVHLQKPVRRSMLLKLVQQFVQPARTAKA